MVGIALAALLQAAPPQDTGTVDAPVWESRAFRVSIPRPFADWVFEAGAAGHTATVIFHPRGVALATQLWGALGLTTGSDRVPLRLIAERRYAATWRPRRAGAFTILQRDSTELAGCAAIRTAMRGVVDGVAVEVDEYVVARGRDLVVLQLRYPSGVPKDSLVAGYGRLLAGLDLLWRPAVENVQAVFAESTATAEVLPAGPWQVRAYDALVRYDPEVERAAIEVRVELRNASEAPADSVLVWLWPALDLDSVSATTVRLSRSTYGSITLLRLAQAVPAEGNTAVTFRYRLAADAASGPLPAGLVRFEPGGAYLAADWLPRVQPRTDSAGQPVAVMRPRYTLRFDVPAGWRAVAPGRLVSELVTGARRRVTWMADALDVSDPAFALGPYDVAALTARGVAVRVWWRPSDEPQFGAGRDSIVALARAGWAFYSRAFGDVPAPGLELVWCDRVETLGRAGLLLVGADVSGESGAREWKRDWCSALLGELARTWWGGSIAFAGSGSAWMTEALPAWAAVAARGALEGDTVRQRLVREAESLVRGAQPAVEPLARLALSSVVDSAVTGKGIAALEAARRAAGEARFREQVLTLTLAHRNAYLDLDALLAALGSDAGAVLRPFLF